MAACAVSAPAAAQRASLADRVAALEARSNNNQANVDLLNQLTQLRAEVQTLRAQVDSATFAEATEAVRAALSEHLIDGAVTFAGNVWIVTARRP